MTKIEKIIDEVAKENNIKLNFSDLNVDLKSIGIDSLAAMNLIIQVEEKLGVSLDDEVLINIKTLSQLIDAFNQKI